jgi:AcrR family transcriptional regulator
MDQIAGSAKVTKGALYHHFPSKEALYLRLMQDDLNSKKQCFEKAVTKSDSCRERLYQLTYEFFCLPRPKQELIRLIRRDNNIFNGDVRSLLIQSYQESLPQIIEQVIKDGIENGELKEGDPRLLSWFYVSLIECTLRPYSDQIFEDINSKIEHTLDFFFTGACTKTKRNEHEL